MNDRNDHRHPTEVFVNGGEPPHDYYHPDYYRPGPRYIPAPIGYRHYRQFYYSTYYPQRPIPVEVSAPYVEVQCSGQQPITGTVLGGVAGALVGNQFGHARGNVFATVGGALLGAVIGQSIDQQNESCAYQALEYAEPNTQVGWVDPNSNDAYTVTPGPITQINGLYCREYQAKILVGNTIQNGYGQACRQPDGSWQTAD
jgi:surface antigen